MMRVMMKSYMTTAAGVEFKPGDVPSFEDGECERLVSVGGARYATAEEVAAAEALEAKVNIKGKTVEQLREFAAEHKIELGADLKKRDDIIAAIELALEQRNQPLKQDGPTVAEFVAAGYQAKNYPPAGYASRSSGEEIAAAVKLQNPT